MDFSMECLEFVYGTLDGCLYFCMAKSNHKPLGWVSMFLYEKRGIFVLRKYWCFRGDTIKISQTSDDHKFFVRTSFCMFLDSMEIHLSLESIHIFLDNIGTHIRSRNHENSRPYWLLVATVYGKSPISDGYNFFVRTLF